MNSKIIVFEDKRIRRTWFNDEWWYVAVDIIEVLTNSKNPASYLKDMRRRDESFAQGWGQIATPLSIETQGGVQKINCVSTKGAFRLIQSVPSLKAEPFKMWLAQLGEDRINEIENPELAQDRVKEYYELKGYPKDWIDKRLRGIAIRQELTDEWKNRGIENPKDFAILTNEIHKATFEVSINEHKNIKNFPTKTKANLRDHMTDLELIFSILGERATTEITQVNDSRGFEHLNADAKKGGDIAKNARLELQKETKQKVVSQDNYFNQTNKKKVVEK
ncbi:MAG: Bro-N domain-containing protein [Candidatus Woesearchaeota archaeon]